MIIQITEVVSYFKLHVQGGCKENQFSGNPFGQVATYYDFFYRVLHQKSAFSLATKKLSLTVCSLDFLKRKIILIIRPQVKD